MPTGTVKKVCRVCYDTKWWNGKQLIYVENMDNHYVSANKRNNNGVAIPYHPPHVTKGYFYKNGKVDINIKHHKQTNINTFFKTTTPKSTSKKIEKEKHIHQHDHQILHQND